MNYVRILIRKLQLSARSVQHNSTTQIPYFWIVIREQWTMRMDLDLK